MGLQKYSLLLELLGSVKRENYLSALLLTIFSLPILSACTAKEPTLSKKYLASSHIAVPFIAPRADFCAATSIEMLSSYWEGTTSYTPRLSQKELDGRTLIPAKGGTLQVELVATARANAFIVYPLTPTLDALIYELEKQHPVIVLVNRAYFWYPLWHYAVVTGYDREKGSIVTHFSDQANESIPLATFAALWERSENWGVVLLPSDKLPASASPQTFLPAAYALEKTGLRTEAIIAYKSALLRWPKDINILFALANAYYHSQQIKNATKTYHRLLSLSPGHPLAANNLATLLCRKGQVKKALKVLQKAKTKNEKMEAIINETRKEIIESPIKGCV